MYDILKEAGRKAHLVGNIGNPALDELLHGNTKEDVYVYELSSYQLDDILYSPHISVITNFFRNTWITTEVSRHIGKRRKKLSRMRKHLTILCTIRAIRAWPNWQKNKGNCRAGGRRICRLRTAIFPYWDFIIGRMYSLRCGSLGY